MSSNVWNQFKGLLPKDREYIVTVNTLNSDLRTSTCTTAEGHTVILEGQNVSTGNKALVRGDKIVSQVPNLTASGPVYV